MSLNETLRRKDAELKELKERVDSQEHRSVETASGEPE